MPNSIDRYAGGSCRAYVLSARRSGPSLLQPGIDPRDIREAGYIARLAPMMPPEPNTLSKFLGTPPISAILQCITEVYRRSPTGSKRRVNDPTRIKRVVD